MSRVPCAVIVALSLVTAGCSDHTRTVWHDVRLPSGTTIKVTQFMLAWGVEHDDRNAANDSFALEYVSAGPGADPKQREAEAGEVFELVRGVSEQMGLRTASIAAFPSLERKGQYDLYRFDRQPDGHWSSTRSEAKVFAND